MRKQTINASIKNAVEIAEGTSAYIDHIKRVKKILYRGMAVIASASAASANADILYFENPEFGEEGHYDWHWGQSYTSNWLDITQGPDNQSNILNSNSVGQINESTNYYFNETRNGAEVTHVENSGFTKAFSLGDMLDGSFDWFHGAIHAREDYYGNVISDFAEGVRAYIGVRTLSGNYGWIAVERGFEDSSGYNFTAFAWAFETEPGVPIRAGEIPAPGTLALLAFGAVMREKRKRN